MKLINWMFFMVACCLFGANSYAQSVDRTVDSVPVIGSHCVLDGKNTGTVEYLPFVYELPDGTTVTGTPRVACIVRNGTNTGMTTADLFFSPRASIAATYLIRGIRLKDLPAWDPNRYSNPAVQHCQELGGITMPFSGAWTEKNGGQTDLCTFADGSFLSYWTLQYVTLDPNFLGIRSQITAKPLPPVFKLPYSQ